LEQSGPAHAALLVHLLASVKQSEYLKYVLVLIEEIFDDIAIGSKAQRVGWFLGLRESDSSRPFGPLLSLLDMQDPYLQYLAAQHAGTLVLHVPEEPESDSKGKQAASPASNDVGSLMLWIVSTLRENRDRYRQRAAIKCLQSVLQQDSLRRRFSTLHGLQYLSAVLNDQYKAVVQAKQKAVEGFEKSESGSGEGLVRDLQLVYETLFCCWLLSFNSEIAERDFTGTSIVLNCVRIMREVDKEKIRRVGLAMLRNLSGKAQHDEAMIHAGFWKVVQQFSTKRWGDEDIPGDVQFLLEKMEAKMLDMTTWDRYKQELLSGQLEWSPAHRSEKFWKENFSRFNDRNFDLVGVLAALLRSPESQTVAIALHDLGEFARYHPLGKKILSEQNIRPTIMSMIDSTDLAIQQQALLAVQKLMVANWEYLAQAK